MLKLYQFAASGNSRIVRIALVEKGLAFERVNINVGKGENRRPEYLRINPRGKVPALVHVTPGGEVTIFESTIINEYLEETFPERPLMPDDAAGRARVRVLTQLFDVEMSPAAGPLIIETLLRTAQTRKAEVVAEHQKATRLVLTTLLKIGLERNGGPFLAGEYSLADASFTPAMSVMETCGIDLQGEFPALARWFELVKGRLSFAASAK